MKLLKAILCIAVLPAVISCGTSSRNNIAHDTLEVSPAAVSFDVAPAVKTVDVTTSFDEVTVKASQEWCTAALNRDNTKLTINVEASGVASRTATITLSAAKGKTATVNVTQGTEETGGTVVRFGLIADIQYADKPNTGRYYRQSLQKVEDAVKYFNEEEVDFTVNLGDLVDEDTPKNMGPLLTRLEKLDASLYNTTGNHDYGNVADNAALYRQLGMPAEYYSFTAPGWRFIMLNTNEISEYASDTPEESAELADIRRKMRETGRRYVSYNGGISKKQMAWLEQELKKSVEESVKTIVLSHHPLYGPTGLTALNDVEITDLLSKYASTVKVAIAGHHHSGHNATLKGIPYITTEGVVETETNAYGIVTLSADRIELKGKGRTRSHTVMLK